ncbi:MAG: hypothetical protein QY326_06330 [Bdellovibrionota bacterium]|nr:MAG: hypothetical protein QY326_06330 [Bdellovibrionota bacterium]
MLEIPLSPEDRQVVETMLGSFREVAAELKEWTDVSAFLQAVASELQSPQALKYAERRAWEIVAPYGLDPVLRPRHIPESQED